MSAQRSWTTRWAAAQTRRHAKALRKVAEQRCAEIAHLWGDENGFMERLPDEILSSIRAQLDDLEAQLDDIVREAMERDG